MASLKWVPVKDLTGDLAVMFYGQRCDVLEVTGEEQDNVVRVTLVTPWGRRRLYAPADKPVCIPVG